jgi:hypothetical protein
MRRRFNSPLSVTRRSRTSASRHSIFWTQKTSETPGQAYKLLSEQAAEAAAADTAEAAAAPEAAMSEAAVSEAAAWEAAEAAVWEAAAAAAAAGEAAAAAAGAGAGVAAACRGEVGVFASLEPCDCVDRRQSSCRGLIRFDLAKDLVCSASRVMCASSARRTADWGATLSGNAGVRNASPRA